MPTTDTNLSTSTRHFERGTHDIETIATPHINTSELEKIAPLVAESIDKGYYPGAVILAAAHGNIIYKGIFGNRRILPNCAPMNFDTIFDVASLTKVIITTTAIMQLVEQEKLQLDTPVAQYWPAFAAQNKQQITPRELLTHTSGLQANIASPQLDELLNIAPTSVKSWHGKFAALQQIEQLPLSYTPLTQFVYSDINFIALGYLIELISGENLADYAKHHILQPLGMYHTTFLPSATLRDRIAPTQFFNQKLHWGEAHDPTTALMDGVAGSAGLFATAEDLGIFAQFILDGYVATGSQKNSILQPATIQYMTKPQTPPALADSYGLGWNIFTSQSCRGTLTSKSAFSHTGWTGTSLLIDPDKNNWLIILTSRTHPQPANMNKLIQDRRMIANWVAASIS